MLIIIVIIFLYKIGCIYNIRIEPILILNGIFALSQFCLAALGFAYLQAPSYAQTFE